MSVIIRLQNLPWSANALDIRQFFQGLSIPEGGVHIVGGELGDAFIAFSTDEDARQAFNRSNGRIKETQVKLLLSSRTEMQKVIEAARNQSMAVFMNNVPSQPIMPSIVPSAVPEIKKEDKFIDRRDRRKSRSKSRDRKERSYDRKRERRRDRSRSKSRDRSSRDRRRRDRSKSRDRTRSRDRDRKTRENRRNNDKGSGNNNNFPNSAKEPRVGVWEVPPQTAMNNPPATNSANLLASFMANNILPNIVTQPAVAENLNQQRDNFQSRWDHNNSFNNMNNSPGDSGKSTFIKYEDRGNNYNNNQRNSGGNDNRRDRAEMFPNCCVKLEPFFGPFGEVRRFFNGLFIHNNGIKFINDEFGKRTGIVYIKFAYPEGKDEALGRSGDKVRNQIVTLTHIDDDEFERAVDRYMPDDFNEHEEQPKHFGKRPCTCLLIYNVPQYLKEMDLKNMFCSHNIAVVVFDAVPRGKNAYLKFATSGEATKAFKDKESQVIDGKLLRVEFCPDDVFEKVKSEIPIEVPLDPVPEPSNTIAMSGLPMKCSERDIIDFFSDIGVMPSKINLVANELGFSGEAVCEFYTVDAAVMGYAKNGMPFGNGTVLMKYQANTNKTNLNTNYLNKQQVNPNQGIQMQNQRMPFPNNNMNNMNAPYMNVNRPPFFPRNNFMGGPRGPPRFPMPGNHMGPRGPPRRFNQHHQAPPPQEDCEEELAPAGCILLMENVPYKAGLDEIMEFLEGFDIPSENVLRKYNPNGLPSGETKVIFNSPNEVYQVIEAKKGSRIRDRLVYLSQI